MKIESENTSSVPETGQPIDLACTSGASPPPKKPKFTICPKKKETVKKRIIDHLKKHPHSTKKQLLKISRVSTQTALRIFNQLLTELAFQRSGGRGVKKEPYTYSLIVEDDGQFEEVV